MNIVTQAVICICLPFMCVALDAIFKQLKKVNNHVCRIK